MKGEGGELRRLCLGKMALGVCLLIGSRVLLSSVLGSSHKGRKYRAGIASQEENQEQQMVLSRAK